MHLKDFSRYGIFVPVMIGTGVFLSSCVAKKQPPAPITQPPLIIQESKKIPTQPPVQPPVQTLPTQPQVQPAESYRSFYEWKQSFENRVQDGRVESLVASASLNQNAITLDSNQAEFSKMVWEYLDGAVSNNRVSQARSKRQEMINTLTNAEYQYGVPASIVTAIWGLESSFGANMGQMNLVNSLSSLAYEGRRRAFAENELISMARMIERGDVSREQLVGSWAGGMGHTQFIPSTWLTHGVDGDGDGRKNPFTKVDALTATANYLANSGWVRGLPAYIEVSLPYNFDHGYLGKTLTLDEWRALGLTAMEGEYLSGQYPAELFLPAGINGPKLLTTQNFNVIKVYNNSSNYALAVAVLANRMNGKSGLIASFPRHESGLSRYQIQRLQENLSKQGFDTKGVDGIAGTNTRLAFARWQAANGQIPDGFITQNSAARLVY